jgi:RNA recognition motif-containing protein
MKPRGFAFIEFLKEEDAFEALRKMNGFELEGRQMAIVIAEDRRHSSDKVQLSDREYRNNSLRSRSRSRDRGGRYSRRDNSPTSHHRYDNHDERSTRRDNTVIVLNIFEFLR